MRRRTTWAWLSGTAASVALLVGVAASNGRAGNDASALLDPRYVAANGCGTLTKGRGELFKPGLAVPAAAEATTAAAVAIPLIDGLGELTLAVTAANPRAQTYVEQGLRLAFGFNHAAATASFRAAQDADPSCAMCDWGEADVLGPNINAAMDARARRPAFAAAAQARALADGASPLERAEPSADRLRGAVPAAGHLVHMPSHIHYRIGRYLDALAVNRDAVAADERVLAQIPDDAIYAYGYYPHNVHCLLVSAPMAGARQDALAAAAKLGRVMSDDVAARLGWVQAIKTAPSTAHAQFSDPETILALPAPAERFPFVRAFWHYARAVAQLRAGEPDRARVERAAIEAIRTGHDFSALEAQHVPVDGVLTIAAAVVDARLLAAAGRWPEAAALLEEAAAIQDTLPYLEPPFWYHPGRQTLGAIHLLAGDPAAAEDAFRASLMAAPNNGWSRWGLEQALDAQGDAAGADAVADLLAKAWIGDRDLLALRRL